LIICPALLQLLQPGPAVSTNSSATNAQDFSALLTELVGPGDEQCELTDPGATLPVSDPALASTVPESNSPTPQSVPAIAPVLDLLKKLEIVIHGGTALQADDEVAGSDKQAAQPPSTPVQVTTILALLHFLKRALEQSDGTSESASGSAPESEPEGSERPADEPQALLADLKKFELTIRREAARPTIVAAAGAQQNQEQPPALVTSDPLVNARQAQLPPRLIPVRVHVEPPPQSRPKNQEESHTADPSESSMTVPTFQLADPTRPVERVEQPLPAQLVEIPEVPRLQVVRTVAMEVGDDKSHVIIRIEDRGGNMNLHFGAGDDTMRHSLQSSIDSLVHALRRERIDVSNVEVSGKSPIEKVRRMKEAHNG